MSVNLYLSNKVRELDGFKRVPYTNGPGENMTLNGMHVFDEKGRLYLMWSVDVPIPDELKDLMEEVSCYETIPQMGRREAGIYRHESAECELTPEDHGNAKREKPVYMLKLKAKKLEDIQALMRKVKTGTIRPEESYEEPQSGKTRPQLESELQTHFERELRKEREEHSRLRCKIRGIAYNLRLRSSWPFCLTNTVARKLEATLTPPIE